MVTFKKLASAAAVALCVFCGQNASAQKIAVIDSREVLSALPAAVAANQQIQALTKAYTDSLQNMQTTMQAKAEAYQKVLDTMSPEAKQRAQADMTSMQENYMKFRDAKFGQDGDLARQQASLLKPIVDKTTEAISAIAKRDKYAAVLDKANGTVVFSDATIDITQKLVDYMKNGK